MTDPNEMNSYSAQVRRSLSEKETDELVDIWLEDDREGWTDEAFQAIEAILTDRLGALPDRDSLEEDVEDEIEIEYLFDQRLFRIANWSGRMSWVILGTYIIATLFSFFIKQSPSDWAQWRFVDWIVNSSSILERFLFGGFMFLVLQAINEIIYLIIDIRDLLHPDTLFEEISTPIE